MREQKSDCINDHIQVPLWVWLVWSPQLLMSLQRGEGPHARALLTQIAQAFPQAIYYSLRTMVLCLREFAFKVVQVSLLCCFVHAVCPDCLVQS